MVERGGANKDNTPHMKQQSHKERKECNTGATLERLVGLEGVDGGGVGGRGGGNVVVGVLKVALLALKSIAAPTNICLVRIEDLCLTDL